MLGPDGALYFQEGTFHQTQIETIYGPVRNHNGCVWRFEPRTHGVSSGTSPTTSRIPTATCSIAWGQDFVTDGTGNVNYHALPFSGFIPHPEQAHADTSRSSSNAARRRVRRHGNPVQSSHFPAENQGNYLIANVIGFLGIFQYKVLDQGSGFTAEEVEPLVQSTDPNFRPSDIEVGADGAVYFLDWHNAIIGHLQTPPS